MMRVQFLKTFGRNSRRRNTKLILFLTFLIFSNFSLAQIDAKIDKDHIKIGEEIHYSISVPLKSSSSVQFFQVKDTLSFHIEILDQKIDTVIENEQKKLIQKLTLTSYDAGDFLIRSLPIIIDSDTLLSNSFQIKVDDVEIDSANLQGFSIKPIMDEKFTFKDYWDEYGSYFLVGIFLLLALILLFVFISKRKKKGKQVPIKTPVQEAKDALKSLDKKKYLDKSEINPYYSELSFIIRRYLGRVYEFSSLELLSDDLVEHIQKNTPLEEGEVEKLKQFLFDSDLVKFAKSIPEESKHKIYRKWADELIEKAKPIGIEEDVESSQTKKK